MFLNLLRPLVNFICIINKGMNFIYPYLPLINSIITIIFILLGIAGAIAFGMGFKFKNIARNVYSSVHLITTFICMLIIFHLTYCSLVIPNNHESKNEVPPKEPTAIQDDGGGLKMPEFKMPIPNLPKSITNGIGDIFSFINNLIKNNTVPFIIVQVLCVTIIVIVCTLMSSIYGGIAKAGYELHCSASNEIFNIPWWGNLVDFFMHILLIISSIYAIIYFIIKLFTDIFTSLPASSSKSLDTKNINDKMPSGVRKRFAKYFNIMNDWPIIRGIFIISLSYYIIQLLLRLFEDFISYIIVSFFNWQKRETECSDEPNKNSKTDMGRMITLIINIIIFVILVIITIVLLIINIFYSPVIIQLLSFGQKFYIPTAAAISGDVDLKSITKIVSDATNGKVNEQKIQEISHKVLATLENSGEKLDLKQILASINDITIGHLPVSLPALVPLPVPPRVPALVSALVPPLVPPRVSARLPALDPAPASASAPAPVSASAPASAPASALDPAPAPALDPAPASASALDPAPASASALDPDPAPAPAPALVSGLQA